jgi:hypothetical protein
MKRRCVLPAIMGSAGSVKSRRHEEFGVESDPKLNSFAHRADGEKFGDS